MFIKISLTSVFVQLCWRILMASAITAARISSFPFPFYQNTSVHLQRETMKNGQKLVFIECILDFMTLTCYLILTTTLCSNCPPQGKLVKATKVIYLLNNRPKIYKACLASSSKYCLQYYRTVIEPNHKNQVILSQTQRSHIPTPLKIDEQC